MLDLLQNEVATPLPMTKILFAVAPISPILPKVVVPSPTALIFILKVSAAPLLKSIELPDTVPENVACEKK